MVGGSGRKTTVQFSNESVVVGRFATDLNGDRKIRLLFQSGTTAKIPTTGDSASFNGINLRLTEYTVGADGPMSMPGLLPPGSAYTYCLDFSVDEADSIGQTDTQHRPAPDVEFSNHVF